MVIQILQNKATPIRQGAGSRGQGAGGREQGAVEESIYSRDLEKWY
ncbi:MAG: hypothetical protein ACRAVC_15375 [Trichormus sp.]